MLPLGSYYQFRLNFSLFTFPSSTIIVVITIISALVICTILQKSSIVCGIGPVKGMKMHIHKRLLTCSKLSVINSIHFIIYTCGSHNQSRALTTSDMLLQIDIKFADKTCCGLQVKLGEKWIINVWYLPWQAIYFSAPSRF